VLAAGGIAAVAIAVALLWPITDLIAAHDVGGLAGPQRTVHLQAAREATRTELLVLAAGLFAAAALVYAARNFTLARRTFQLTGQGQATDRYIKAIEQLGSDKLDVRIGGVYALERVARDSAGDHPTVMEVLAVFVREHAREQWPALESGANEAERTMAPDVRAAITVVGRRDPASHTQPINLDGVDLQGMSLSGMNLSHVHLAGANLSGAVLHGTSLHGANLTRASLTGADLTGADLTGAHLDAAELANADLSRAVLTAASLDGADLRGANLLDTSMSGAILTYAKLTGANLTGADLTGADLRDANLRGTDRDGATFTDADLGGTAFSSDAAIPEGWIRESDSGRLTRVTGRLDQLAP